MVRNTILFGVAVAVALLCCEGGIRWFYRDLTTTYDNRSYFALRWKRDHLRLNRMGYRDVDIDPAKPTGVYRVAVVGDSFAFGQGIEEAERFSNLLERRLDRPERRVQVLNFGRPGNNTADELAVLKKDVLHMQPDFVLLQWYVNDVEVLPGNNDEAPPVEPAGASFVNSVKQTLLNRLATYFFVAEAVHRARAWRGATHATVLFDRVGNPDTREARAADAALREFIRACREHGVRIGLLLVPDLGLINDAYPYDYLHERVLAICRAEELSCVDLLPLFEPYLRDSKAYTQLWVNRFDAHMNGRANELATARVMEAFGQALGN